MLASEPKFFDNAIELPDWFPAHLMLLLHGLAYVAAGWALLWMKDKGQTTGDLIRLTHRAMRDPNGPAARYLATAKSSLATVKKIRFTADRDAGPVRPLPPMLPRRPMNAPPPMLIQPVGSPSSAVPTRPLAMPVQARPVQATPLQARPSPAPMPPRPSMHPTAAPPVMPPLAPVQSPPGRPAEVATNAADRPSST